MTRLDLTLLGGFSVRSDAGPLSVPTRKAQALLAYLALPPGRAHPRDKLAALLWGDTAEEQARASLRQALSALRRTLPGPPFSTEGETVALDPGAVSVDAVVFERRIGEGTAEALAEAAGLYQGDLLAGLAVKEAPFEEWLLGERERLRELAVEGLAKLLAHQRAAGATEAALQTALRLVTLDPLQEPVHRTLMRLYAATGRRGAALRQYQQCVVVLQRELGVEPEAETKQLYQEILRQRSIRAPADAAPAAETARARSLAPPARPEALAHETGLIGRQPQMARLGQSLDEAERGEGQVVAVLGEAGVGKTRLVEEVAAEALRRGHRVLSGRCYESEQVLPLAPWADAFRRGHVIEDAERLGLGRAWLLELGRLFPELAEPGLQPSPNPVDYLRLFEAIAQLVARVATQQPLMLLLEDLHWADDMSVRLLSFLGRRALGWRVLVMGTAREEDLGGAPALRHALDELGRDQRLVTLALSPLSPAETVTLVRALARAGSDESMVARLGERVWLASGGNPLLVVETVRSLPEGMVPEVGELVLPERVRDMIAGRLERLGARSRELLDIAAVIGREFDFPLLQRASGLGEDEAARGLEELVRCRVIHGVGERFDFTHDQIRGVVYGLLGPRRKLLHGRVARALEALYPESLPLYYGALALHYRENEGWRKVVEYLTRFAETAARRYAHAEAAAALQEALGHAERLRAEERDARVLDLVLRQADLFFFLGRLADTVELLLRQRERLERLGDASLAGPYHFSLAQAYSLLGDRAQAADSAHRAIDTATRCGDDATLGKAHGVLAREAYWLGQPLEGVGHARQAVALLEHTEERYGLSIAHWLVGRNLGVMGEFDAALDALSRAQAIAEMLGDRRLQSHIAWTVGDFQAIRGDWETGIATCERALDLSPDALNTANGLGALGAAHVEKGDFGRAIPLLQQSLEQLRAIAPSGQARGWFTMLLGEAHLLKGELDQARELTAQGLAILQGARYRRGIGWAQRILGRIAQASGDYSAADSHLREALQTFVAVSAPFEAGRTHLALADLAHVRGDLSAVATHLDEADRLFAEVRASGYVERTRELAARLDVSLSAARRRDARSP